MIIRYSFVCLIPRVSAVASRGIVSEMFRFSETDAEIVASSTAKATKNAIQNHFL